MSERNLGFLITTVIVLLVSVTQIGRPDMFDSSGGFGTASFWLGILAAVIGVILCIFLKTKQFGQGMILSGGLLLLIGFSVCSGGFGLIK